MVNKARIQISPAFWFLLVLLILVLPFPWLAALCISSAVHELSHLAAVWFAGSKVIGFRLGVDGMYMETIPMQPLQSAICSIAGPLGALTLVLLAPWMPRTALCALIQSAYHLLPLYPLDGGQALRNLTLELPWGRGFCIFIETAVLIILALLGLYLTFATALELLPFCLSLFVILRTCREKFLANRCGKGYNRSTK